MKIEILYEDTNVLAINKPAGVMVHSDGRNKNKTITDWVLKNYPKMENVGELMTVSVGGKEVEIKRPGVVHRLDKDTSGVLLLAKTKKMHEWLKAQFSAPALAVSGENTNSNSEQFNSTDLELESEPEEVKPGRIKKVYNAVVSGSVKNERGVVNKPIGRSPNDFRKWLSGRGARGELREATTEYTVIKRFEEDGYKYTLLEIRPRTGRTHQIRVHMKYLNHPVVCDGLYNPGKPHPQGFTRLALHAKSIKFTDLKGEVIKIEAPLPEEFLNIKE